MSDKPKPNRTRANPYLAMLSDEEQELLERIIERDQIKKADVLRDAIRDRALKDKKGDNND